MAKLRSNDPQEVFIKQLREMRKEAGLTQVQLAERLGKLQSYVSKHEMGERRMDVLELIEVCEACGVDVITFIQELKSKL